MTTLDIEALLAPISAENPAGTDVRTDSGAAALYFRMKDARSAAREAERRADTDPDNAVQPPEWRQMVGLGTEILATKSKDLEVAAWLMEAALRVDGFAGLRDALAVADGLVERYWDGLHPVDEEDPAAKVAPLAGLNGTTSDGALIQPLRLAPLTAPGEGPPAGLWHHMVQRKRGSAAPEAVHLATAVRATSAAEFKEIYHAIGAAADIFAALTARLDGLCGDTSPPSSTIAATLAEAQEALREISGISVDLLTGEPVVPPAAAPSAPAAQDPATVAPVAPAGPAPLATREDALRELARIAAFFREHEPNSPTAYALQTLIHRARLPLRDLLIELIPDEAARRIFLTSAGIGSDNPASA